MKYYKINLFRILGLLGMVLLVIGCGENDYSEHKINGNSVDEFSQSVILVKKSLSKSKLTEFNDSLSIIEFVIGDNIIKELDEKTVDEVISTAEEWKKLYVKQAENNIAEGIIDFSNNFLAFFHSYNDLLDHWNAYADNYNDKGGDINKSLELQEEFNKWKKNRHTKMKEYDIYKDKYTDYTFSSYQEAKNFLPSFIDMNTRLIEGLSKDVADMNTLKKRLNIGA